MDVMGTFTKTGLTIHWGKDHDCFKFVASSSGTYTVTPRSRQRQRRHLPLRRQRDADRRSTARVGHRDDHLQLRRRARPTTSRPQTYNSTTSSNYQVAWNLQPLATQHEQRRRGRDGGRRVGRFRIAQRPARTAAGLNFTLGGTASNGVDYQTVATASRWATSTASSTSRSSRSTTPGRRPRDDHADAGHRQQAYVVGARARVVIADNDVSSPGPILPNAPGPASSTKPRGLFGRSLIEEDDELALLA